MDVVTLGLVLTGVSTLMGGAQLYGQLRRIDTLEHLRTGLQDIIDAGLETPHPEEDQELVRWLNYSAMIIPSLRSRVLSRVAVGILCILGVFGGERLVALSNALTTDKSQLVATLVGGALQLAIGLSYGARWFLDPAEKKFLQNVDNLQARFYRRYVVPAITNFNEIVGTHPIFEAAGREGRGRRAGLERRVKKVEDK